MTFRISGLPIAPFEPLFRLSDAELSAQGARRYTAEPGSGMPCRVSLQDAEPGETVLLTPYPHQPSAASPYRASGPVFVRESARDTFDRVNDVPKQLRDRLLSVRAYSRDDCILDADVVAGTELEPLIDRLFARSDTAYLHAHFARYGCYACRIDRA